MAIEKNILKRIPPPGDNASDDEICNYYSAYSWDELEQAGYLRKLTTQEQAESNKTAELAKERMEIRKNLLNLGLL